MPSRWMVGMSLSALLVIAVAACSSVSNGRSTTGTSASSSGSAQNGGNYQLPSTVTSLRIDGDAVSIDVTAQDSASAVTVREQLHGKATTTKEVTGSPSVRPDSPSGSTAPSTTP